MACLALAVAFSVIPVSHAAPTTDERLAALEAYINNTDPGKSLTGVPGPGHNAWMMTSSALVLFMTLPGLALFYGGLVRMKNILPSFGGLLAIVSYSGKVLIAVF